MSLIKSFSVGDGDMFYIKHGNHTMTIIDCNLTEDVKDEILDELEGASQGMAIQRFISTHPDEDHIHGLEELNDRGLAHCFYCVENSATKEDETKSFKCYKKLRADGERAYFLKKGVRRAWLNKEARGRGSAGLSVLWPVIESKPYQEALEQAASGKRCNNISPVVRYSLQDGASVLWMGDLEHDFMESISDEIELQETDIVFAPHHGRKSGRIPAEWLDKVKPQLIVVGEAPSDELDYYSGYNTITQNSAGDIAFECHGEWVDVYVGNANYRVGFLLDRGCEDMGSMSYIGSLRRLYAHS